MKHMAIIESTDDMREKYTIKADKDGWGSFKNSAFYTTDGMRFELRNGETQIEHPLYESGVSLCLKNMTTATDTSCKGCGSFGLNNNPDGTTKPPCLIMVDVNGDRKPNPANINCKNDTCAKPYKFSDAEGRKLTDMFTIMITDKEAIPYGVAAQKAMYQSQK